MITIKKKSTTINYPFNELVNLIEDSTTSVPLRMVGIKRHLIAPKVTISGSKIYVQERRIKAVYYPNRNGDTVVEYYYEIHWLVLILWIISVFPLLVGIVWVPIIVISSIFGINFRIRSINKYAYDALIELNPVKVNQTSTYTQKVILNDSIQKTTNTPPPIRKNVTNTEYFIVINEEQKGPYDFEKIKLLISFNNINETTLIWKEGMEDWEEILNLNEFKQEFN